MRCCPKILCPRACARMHPLRGNLNPFAAVSWFERSAGVHTRSPRNSNRMLEVSKALPLPSAAAGTAAFRRIAN